MVCSELKEQGRSDGATVSEISIKKNGECGERSFRG